MQMLRFCAVVPAANAWKSAWRIEFERRSAEERMKRRSLPEPAIAMSSVSSVRVCARAACGKPLPERMVRELCLNCRKYEWKKSKDCGERAVCSFRADDGRVCLVRLTRSNKAGLCGWHGLNKGTARYRNSEPQMSSPKDGI